MSTEGLSNPSSLLFPAQQSLGDTRRRHLVHSRDAGSPVKTRSPLLPSPCKKPWLCFLPCSCLLLFFCKRKYVSGLVFLYALKYCRREQNLDYFLGGLVIQTCTHSNMLEKSLFLTYLTSQLSVFCCFRVAVPA